MRISFLLLILIIANTIYAQSVVNGSFEGLSPGNAILASPWSKCNNTINNSPDIFPGSWNVTLPASDGDTYLNLVVKEDNAKESIFGIIEPPFKTGSCYKINIDIAVTDQFIFDFWGDIFDFTNPARLLVYLGPTQCDSNTLIFDFNNLTSPSWKTYSKIYKANYSTGGIQLITDFNTPAPYYGHVLIDNITIQHSGDTIESHTYIIETGNSFDLSMTESEGAIYKWIAQNSKCDTYRDNIVIINEDEIVYGVKYDSSMCFSEYYKYNFITAPEIPNVFTPNNDGINDLFKPSIGANITFINTLILNRWGEVIHESNQINEGWNGRTISGIEVPEGTYFYIIEVKGDDWTDPHIYKGALTLMR